ncbi:hypothetical protein PGT21_018136 [Puccinia graminis f. sp. tritici]|nr:hypothetical protein PGT21_018136 [Puccinia graminis f. sp. tritici]KAA1093429.1 hypothetical protein PGTUg99_012862 [Puccinia graminis f. sp. tritici]
MRFALVAGALVLGATVSDARSVAPSPSKGTTETIEFSTPSRNLKRARQDDGDWNPIFESDDASANQDSIDPSAYQSQPPSGGKPTKKSRASWTSDGVNRTTLP